MAKHPTEAERSEQIMKIVERSRKFGSMTEHLSPEFLNRERDFSDLTKELAKRAKPELPTPEQDRLMNTPYGLPQRHF